MSNRSLPSRPRVVLLITVALVGLITGTFPLLFGISSPLGELFALASRGMTSEIMKTNDLSELEGVIAMVACAFNMLVYGVSALLWYFIVRGNSPRVRNAVTLSWCLIYLLLFYVFFPAKDLNSILFPT